MKIYRGLIKKESIRSWNQIFKILYRVDQKTVVTVYVLKADFHYAKWLANLSRKFRLFLGFGRYLVDIFVLSRHIFKAFWLARTFDELFRREKVERFLLLRGEIFLFQMKVRMLSEIFLCSEFADHFAKWKSALCIKLFY